MNSLVLLATLCLMAGTACGLQCYTCEGSDSFFKDGDCGDEYADFEDQLMMCNDTAGEVWCRKEKTGANDVYTFVERGCASQCEERNDGYVRRVTCCNTDGCNLASATTVSLTTLLLSVVVKFF